MRRILKTSVLIYLWAALIEDSVLFVMSWLAPQVWFHLFHNTTTFTVLETAFLRRSGGQWLAFALAQAITLLCWRKWPVWLVITAGVRFSDLFTDICYILAAPALTKLGWLLLLPPPLLNLIGVVIMLRGYEQIRSARVDPGTSRG
ncbi:MAG: hypothetical protein M3128_05200 [Verrucomicrobiota bacterium]|nr:hypothetical protein [Verrucomicrobiota bacterium]